MNTQHLRFALIAIALTAAPAAIADEYTAPAGEAPCNNDKAAPTEFPPADDVWWGNRERAFSPYLQFAKTDLPPLEQKFQIIYFDLDKSFLREEGKMTAKKIAAYMKKNPDAKLSVAGHCCDWATNEYNIKLGQRRADAVKNAIVGHGIDASRITTTTYGEEKPAHDNNSDERPLNRRAEAIATFH